VGESSVKQVWLILLSFILLTVGIVTYLQRKVDPPVQTIVASSLQSLREQNRLSAFAARFVTVVTSSKAQLGLSAEKTLIIPAMVRYEVDLSKLHQEDVHWNGEKNILQVTLPPVEMAGPEFDLPATREYRSGTLLMTLTNVEQLLDAQNRKKAQADVLEQARSDQMLALAEAATARAVASNFGMPLNAAGIKAGVAVSFAQR
jgi:hypothetical protein